MGSYVEIIEDENWQRDHAFLGGGMKEARTTDNVSGRRMDNNSKQ